LYFFYIPVVSIFKNICRYRSSQCYRWSITCSRTQRRIRCMYSVRYVANKTIVTNLYILWPF